MATAASASATGLGPVTNGAEKDISTEVPYIAIVKVEGVADILFHAWNCESVEGKSKAKKGSEAKKSDNVESYVNRNADGEICIPTEYFRGALIAAAKYRQDPRSPRKSAMDIFKAGLVSLEPLVPIYASDGKKRKTWEFLHKCRVQVQRSGITRTRPAFHSGWVAEFPLLVNLPEYLNQALLNDVAQAAGKLIGLADFRPTYGRFQVTSFKVQQD